MTDQERTFVDMTVAAPVDAVWASLREPDRISRWFGWDYDGLTAEIQQIFVDDVVADDERRSLRWPDGDRIDVEPDPSGARLLVRRRGHPSLDADAPGEGLAGVYDPIDEGWITFTQQLRFALERHPDQTRRTVQDLGVSLGPDDDPLLGRLGLRTLGDDPVGSRYTVQRPDGTSFGGEVFFQTDLQVGLTVEDEGDALLVVARTPPTDAPPDGEAMFLLNLYGADDARVAQASAWRRWWGS